MYGFTAHIPAPAEVYHALHRAVAEVTSEEGGDDRLILHLAYKTPRGFDVTEVWESKDDLDAFNATVLPKAMARAGLPTDGPPPDIEEFDPIGLTVPRPFSAEATA